MAEQQTVNNKQGKIIAVCGAKGGIGKTLLSVNLAVALNKKNKDICIVDGDFQFGDVSLAMDIQPTFTVKDVVEEIAQAHDSQVTNFLSSHSSGVKVLSAPERPELADLVSNEMLGKILNDLQLQFDYIVLDTCLGFQDQTAEIMEIADEIFVVTNLEMTSLKNTKIMLQTMEQLGLREKSRLVINRYNMESLIKSEDVPEMLGEKDSLLIPNNFKLASQSMNLGIPAVISQSKSDIAKAIFKMAGEITSPYKENTSGKKAAKKKPSIFNKLIPSSN
ncbi:AAA family ATPase [Evansella clarkii]|uniref:AAA family ATPase n=1 Tax=Evansella clarkii TaxID=79879 RepID=UPI000B4355B0|nr:AAA family ATPase [Evansella clarkii]